MSMWYSSSFFFSSRRRHTRWPRDWSSDVCSSDLVFHLGVGGGLGTTPLGGLAAEFLHGFLTTVVDQIEERVVELFGEEIGRASCRKEGRTGCAGEHVDEKR